jgi:hypothetical protein
MNDVILNFVDAFVKNHQDRIKLWHFLREPSRVTGLFEVRLRFSADEKDLQGVKLDLDKDLLLREKQQPGLYSSHVFGAHGDPDKDYGPELGDFGEKGWDIFADYLMKTSEVAIKFLRDEPLGKSEKHWEHYVERFSHCFWNQLDVPPYILFRSVGPHVFPGLYEWVDMFSQATGLPR